MGITLHEGWSIVTFVDRSPAAGLLRYEKVGEMFQWVLDVPASRHHKAYTAVIDPLSVRSVTPCSDVVAVKYADTASPLRKPPAA
jgi:hypothetical protein